MTKTKDCQFTTKQMRVSVQSFAYRKQSEKILITPLFAPFTQKDLIDLCSHLRWVPLVGLLFYGTVLFLKVCCRRSTDQQLELTSSRNIIWKNGPWSQCMALVEDKKEMNLYNGYMILISLFRRIGWVISISSDQSKTGTKMGLI